VTREQRGYLWGEVYPAFAYGIDRLLVAYGREPKLFTDEYIHDRFKRSHNIYSTELLSISDVADYITSIQAFAAECMIFIASPEEIKRGVSENERENHYDFILNSRLAA
tara:strand:- start:164 stop:490 length:327 start_codon:yes stop_codon:yes gene_type:complete